MANNPKHMENLKHFKPGNNANPKGRPKGSTNLVTILKKYLQSEIDFNDPIQKKKVKAEIGNVVVLKLIEKAIKGDLKAINDIYDRVHGRPLQSVIQQEMPADTAASIEHLKKLAEQEGISVEELAEREGIEL